MVHGSRPGVRDARSAEARASGSAVASGNTLRRPSATLRAVVRLAAPARRDTGGFPYRGRVPLARTGSATDLVGADVEVDCVDGRARRYVNLDYAASAPALAPVRDAVEAFLPGTAASTAGAALKSQVATEAFEGARAVVRAFVGGRPGDEVVFVRNTTEAINVLAAALPAGTRVLATAVEHHANLLPWRRHDCGCCRSPTPPTSCSTACERALRRARRPIRLLAVTGASNVTGEVWPLAELAALAHRHGARLFVDAAQLAPHRAIDMAATGIDLLALSGPQALRAVRRRRARRRPRRLGDGPPLLRGGGAIELVTRGRRDLGRRARPPRGRLAERGRRRRARRGVPRAARARDGRRRRARARARRAARGGAGRRARASRRCRCGPRAASTASASRLHARRRTAHPLVAAVLSAEHAIGVRHGCFCAHLLIARLLGVPDAEVARLGRELRAGARPELPGAVRASLGLGTTEADVDRLVAALHALARRGPRRALPPRRRARRVRAGGRPARPAGVLLMRRRCAPAGSDPGRSRSAPHRGQGIRSNAGADAQR